MGRHFLVTGGTGFIGAALVRRLLREGHRVRVLDDGSRGVARRLGDAAGKIEMVTGDVRDPESVIAAARGVDGVWHLAYVNGTEFFYTRPQIVLDVAVRGMVAVLQACAAQHVPELFLASSSEVYQTPSRIPTDERVPLLVPDPLNPRYSYGGGKIISELMALNHGCEALRRVVIFRPHNVYGPDMGTEHVVPQLALRLAKLAAAAPPGASIDLPIQGTGQETRAFTFIEDLIDGLMLLLAKGANRGIYHIGTDVETSIAELARQIGRCFNHEVRVRAGELAVGGTPRRCPDIGKMRSLGFEPRIGLADGLPPTVKWYTEAERSFTNGTDDVQPDR